ncbi:hypothetical protein GCM10009835_12720 [Planosporangium flavigriseum]|uniref:Integrase catalytic domain-containing protein n=1 Tax=Planosporangium flavigriseum TaxID=373681 RepID=A0A8J3PLX7_9ACTN|nr:hypothetical protein Pfl04_33600 [Planosporangium flavigriseum]
MPAAKVNSTGRRNTSSMEVLRRPVEFTQYTSFRFTTHLAAAGIAASIGSVGDALDNALIESTIGLYKTELIKPRGPWRSLAQVELATAEWVDWYNQAGLPGILASPTTRRFRRPWSRLPGGLGLGRGGPVARTIGIH